MFSALTGTCWMEASVVSGGVAGPETPSRSANNRPVGFAGEEARQFAAQPVAEALRELGVAGIFQSMQNQRAEQHFSAGIVGAFLFSSASLQGLLLRVELGDAFGNASASHGQILRGNVCGRDTHSCAVPSCQASFANV